MRTEHSEGVTPSSRLECRHHPSRGGKCPGCALLHLEYREQREVKRERLVRALARYPHLALPRPTDVVPSANISGYRHRAKLPVDIGPEHVHVGLYATVTGQSHVVLDTPDCPVLAEPLRTMLPPIQAWLAGREGVHSLDLRVSRASGRGMVVFACRGGELHGGPRAARALLRDVPGLATVAVSHAERTGKRVLGSAPRVLAGPKFLEERIGSTTYQLHPGAFFQVDPEQAERIHELVHEMVGDAARVLDLYAGVGAYGLMLAPGRERVLLVEEVPEAAEAARAVAPPHVEVSNVKVQDLTISGEWDAAVLNPARRGSDLDTLRALATLVPRAVYVSCGPETLARDLDVLAAHGLHAARIVPVDLFPQTPEIETVVELKRGPALTSWDGGAVRGPWTGGYSGGTGRPRIVTVLAVGRTRDRGTLDGARYERVGEVATHSLLRLTLTGNLPRALARLRSFGHPIAGEDKRTAVFFAERAGLLRPFVHIDTDEHSVDVPLHGDLEEALERLGGVTAPRGRR
jgi:23S rRNA (uracil1939-C5)-methyltransferase